MGRNRRFWLSWIGLITLVLSSLAGASLDPGAAAAPTGSPTAVVIAGSLQSELGCPGDWQPDCAATGLTYNAEDGIWQATWTVPAGSWEYKAALNNSWDENYGRYAQPGGSNIPLNLSQETTVSFFYDPITHWVTSSANAVVVTAPGSFQSELGCSGDWDPSCLRSWLTDPDEDGIYSRTFDHLPPGGYEAKAAINQSWSENYGAGGVPNGPNIPFHVQVAGSTVQFSYNALSHLLSITVIPPAGHGADNNVEYNGLGHNSRDSLYRTPFGAITPGTPLTLRFRTYHNDVTSVKVRFWDAVAGQQFFREMERVAADLSCYDPAQPNERCDLWQTTYTPDRPNTLYYRFIVRDGTTAAYYDDDGFWDGGWGEATPEVQDESFVVTVYDPAFQPVDWLQNGVVYQIFTDRFRNGRRDNDPDPDEPRYAYPGDGLDQIVRKPWDALPEGYCRNYANPAEPCQELPRGRDYYGGDLRGVLQRLNYLKRLGVSVIWFNPIFESGSNHGYDTQDYYQIDHFFGTKKEFDDLVQQAERLGIRIVLDGVFNHLSSDSPYFDRYGHYESVGACESPTSPYRDWFYFNDVAPGTGACVGSTGVEKSANYQSWWGFDSIPVLNKQNPAVRALLLDGENSVARYWLEQGASGWRLDVMGDTSFPEGFWADFREIVKSTEPDAAIIGELWKKHEVLPLVRGDGADSSMNYRFRNAILGFFGKIDNKSFVDDGQTNQPPSLFASKLLSMREDYPDAAWFTMLNIMDSHDTDRILWSLTPGEANRESKELNQANLAAGKELLKLARVVQMTLPGAPTIYYGDEVGVTGSDDPDDRRTFPWDGCEDPGTGGDPVLLAQYQQLIQLRAQNPVFRQGELSFLLTDDANRTLAYLLRTEQEAAIVAINRSSAAQSLTIRLDGRLPSNVRMRDRLGTIGTVSASDGTLLLNLPPLSAAVLLPERLQDLTPPAAPAGLTATGGANQASLSWTPVGDAAAYRIYRSPVSGGGYVQVGETNGTTTTYTDTGLPNAVDAYYVVRAVDQAGNLGGGSPEATVRPAFAIGWANLQWPPRLVHTISALNRTDSVYGQVYIGGVTNQAGPAPDLLAQVGYGPDGSYPAGNPDWRWVTASFNLDSGHNDEFRASLLPESVGTYDYAYRYSTDGGRTWLYADLDGTTNGYLPAKAGSLTVNPSGDITPPVTPAGLQVTATSPESITLAWEPPVGDPTLYGFEVLRSTVPGGSYTTLAQVTDPTYTDTTVALGTTYYYVVRAVDQSLNRSSVSAEVSATADLRTVAVTFRVSVPVGTAGPVYIAGTLSQLDGGHPDWDPAGTVLTQVDATHWAVTLTGREGTSIEYKYVQGTWDYVEKGPGCEEIANRTLTLSYGSTGSQQVNETVANWRNVSPCGN